MIHYRWIGWTCRNGVPVVLQRPMVLKAPLRLRLGWRVAQERQHGHDPAIALRFGAQLQLREDRRRRFTGVE